MSSERKVRSVTARSLVAVVVTLVMAWTAWAECDCAYDCDCECCPECQPGTGTPGYWKNHPDAWPVEEITIGGEEYTKEDAIAYMQMPVKGDKTLTLFPALVAAKLNVLIGNPSDCIEDTINEADTWMEEYPVGSGVKASSPAWKCGEPLYLCLDKYNNGLLCAPSRDEVECDD